jgi:hypothetical protein
MPVIKFRSIEAMEGNSWLDVGDPRLPDTIRAVWHFASRTAPIRYPPGIYRHRTIESAQAQREAWEVAAHRARQAAVRPIVPGG